MGGAVLIGRAEEDEMVYLERVNAPQDLKTLRIPELERLAREIRDEIYRVTSINGGHFASNLGSVELTLALHYVFDSPRDEIVWDVGHQGYPHKIVTGRRERFDTIRKEGGLSGFLQREESEHDAFGAGHASTSISAALGMAVGKHLKGESGRAIAVIGDGALTGGMAYEALNNAGSLHLPLIVVLNDNEMSIAPNVGAMSKYLSRMRTDERYSKAKAEFERIMHRVPKGDLFLELSERMRDSFKEFVYHTMIWEELGFTYVGPVDGHNVAELIETFQQLKSIDGPVFIHAVTTKGKGYDFAEDDPFKHHAAKVATNGPSAPTPPKYQDVFGEYLTELANTDERIVAITAAMPDGTGLLPFAKAHPERLYDVGIAEQHAVTFAAGLATQGLRPVVAIYSTFLQRAYDQVVHDVCVQNLPVVFALDRAGLVGDDGRTHHGVFDFSYLRCLPNMTIMAPKDEYELKNMILTAVAHDGPIAVRFPRGSGTGVESAFEPVKLPIGRGEIVREGTDITIVAVGSRVIAAENAADMLSERGVSARVVNARFVKPLDEDLLLRCARETGAIVTVEENVLHGGFGAAVLELFMREAVQVPVQCLAIPDVFLDHASQESLRAQAGITAQDIVETALELSTARSTSPVSRESATAVSAIERTLDVLGLNLAPDRKELLDGYVALLLEASSQFNLTALKDPQAIEELLVGGSLELAQFIPRSASSLIDVGTGGGIPGMVLAIVRPDVRVCLLDATTKKVRFLEETAGVLGLSNVTALHGRAEELAHDPRHREQYDLGTARAVARLATLVELVHPFVKPGGRSVFPKGEGAGGELEEARQAIGFVGGRNPGIIHSKLDDTRYVVIDKAKPTPERFPRRVGIPGKRPIGVPVG